MGLMKNNLGTPMTPAQAWLSLNHISTKLGRCSQVCPTVIASLDSYAEERLRDIMSAEDIEKTAPLAARERADQSKNIDPFDPLSWEVPVVCKDCDKRFKVPYRHFQAGVVFHCPHCHGSYVPTLPMYRRVHETFETFFARMRGERDQFTASGVTVGSGMLDAELAKFQRALEQLARELRPAGKMVRRKGLAAMFT